MRNEAQRAQWKPPKGPEAVASLRAAVEARLAALSPTADGAASVLADAIRYALLAPGKRTRPVMTLLCARRFGGATNAALDVGCAFEMVHAASLVFDDLPCMDNAMQRRGRMTTHLLFGEDTAVLAGVALLNEAYSVLGQSALPDGVVRRLIGDLSRSVGLQGLVGGQMRDLRETTDANDQSLTRLNHEKTGALFCAAGEAGAVIGGASDREAGAICTFARHVGAAFQIRDDLLDRASPEITGKDGGQDAHKPTFVSLLGITEARRRLVEEAAAARAALASIGGPGELGAFSDGLLALDWLQGADGSGPAQDHA